VPRHRGGHLELWEERDACLVQREWNQGHRQEGKRQVAPEAAPDGEAACGHGPGDGDCDQQVQEEPGDGALFVMREHQCRGRQDGGGGASNPESGGNHEQHDEDIEQLPAVEPRARGAVGTHCGKQAVPRRQMQRGAESGESRVPTGCGQATVAVLHSTGSFETHVSCPPFDTAAAGLGTPRNQQRLFEMPRALQLERGPHVEPPLLLHLAGDAVLERVRIAREVEPEVALHVQTIQVLPGKTAAALDDAQVRAGIDGERR
jgi:hypothetical protein